jgi:hypothetical protein
VCKLIEHKSKESEEQNEGINTKLFLDLLLVEAKDFFLNFEGTCFHFVHFNCCLFIYNECSSLLISIYIYESRVVICTLGELGILS